MQYVHLIELAAVLLLLLMLLLLLVLLLLPLVLLLLLSLLLLFFLSCSPIWGVCTPDAVQAWNDVSRDCENCLFCCRQIRVNPKP